VRRGARAAVAGVCGRPVQLGTTSRNCVSREIHPRRVKSGPRHTRKGPSDLAIHPPPTLAKMAALKASSISGKAVRAARPSVAARPARSVAAAKALDGAMQPLAQPPGHRRHCCTTCRRCPPQSLGSAHGRTRLDGRIPAAAARDAASGRDHRGAPLTRSSLSPGGCRASVKVQAKYGENSKYFDLTVSMLRPAAERRRSGLPPAPAGPCCCCSS
jgi:hypothetical protein